MTTPSRIDDVIKGMTDGWLEEELQRRMVGGFGLEREWSARTDNV
jgi:hypothetical protein